MSETSSSELNAHLAGLDNREELQVHHGKVLPYIGWYWRDVDFDRPIALGDCGDFVGFMESNKWGYPVFTLTPVQDAEVKAALREIASDPTYEKCREFWNRVQTFRPATLPRVRRGPSPLEQLFGVTF